MKKTSLPQAVLFDLDGTLVDSAHDLGAAANMLRRARDLPDLAVSDYRAMASSGGRGMVGLALGLQPEDAGYPQALADFLQAYAQQQHRMTPFFDQIPALLDALEQKHIVWGVVTNKASRFALPLQQTLPRLLKAAAYVCGDTTPYTKPHPAPLLHAAQVCGVDAGACWYVGDDRRDMQAAQAAGMLGVAAAWGYMGEHALETWQADAVLQFPMALMDLLHRHD